ncbi:hypothetical protein GGX14DRAFT_569009 [Mycena pura]|uniref:Uncharacterized protein n=1 Tax=Mycena pura TaxID=153505 RepID=A0AAD6V891_9AGAR|nr:hypothetical protein GGX14DRAFT_569009 [Mycena pura]
MEMIGAYEHQKMRDNAYGGAPEKCGMMRARRAPVHSHSLRASAHISWQRTFTGGHTRRCTHFSYIVPFISLGKPDPPPVRTCLSARSPAGPLHRLPSATLPARLQLVAHSPAPFHPAAAPAYPPHRPVSPSTYPSARLVLLLPRSRAACRRRTAILPSDALAPPCRRTPHLHDTLSAQVRSTAGVLEYRTPRDCRACSELAVVYMDIVQVFQRGPSAVELSYERTSVKTPHTDKGISSRCTLTLQVQSRFLAPAEENLSSTNVGSNTTPTFWGSENVSQA